MEAESYEHGVPCWVDLGTSDAAGARAFYAGVFGWHIEEGPPEAGGYAIATFRDKPVAGLGGQQSPGPPYWTTYVSVQNADAVAGLVKENGGQVIVEPFDVMDAGRMAVFADPVGAIISVWQPGAHIGCGIINEPNTYSWSELVTTDVERSKEFYSAIFSWDPQTHGDPMSYTEWKVRGRSVGGMMEKPPTMPAEVPPHWGVYFSVRDTDKSVAKVIELGGKCLMEPIDIEPGRFAVVQDPQGAVFQVIHLYGQI